MLNGNGKHRVHGKLDWIIGMPTMGCLEVSSKEASSRRTVGGWGQLCAYTHPRLIARTHTHTNARALKSAMAVLCKREKLMSFTGVTEWGGRHFTRVLSHPSALGCSGSAISVAFAMKALFIRAPLQNCTARVYHLHGLGPDKLWELPAAYGASDIGRRV